ncbi:transmembrane protein 74B-like [Mya arenaria]|uniref:transmembrane protein 74B-like n=1 Tax=Mya arenaria TaxID=6604 RepID=UPI0022E7E4AF|nr:transmembrane protein 74B-like [Mya arenaria]XP_052775542.1 transmembrane protein 74B-like [Mya arenaria]
MCKRRNMSLHNEEVSSSKTDLNKAACQGHKDEGTDYGCVYCSTPTRQVEDILIVTAVVLMSIGFAVMCMGYIIPRGYAFDATLPAREMEQIELHYNRLAYYLDVCVVVGMGFIAGGGIIATSVTMYHYFGSRRRVYRERDRRDLTLLGDRMSTYGTDRPR